MLVAGHFDIEARNVHHKSMAKIVNVVVTDDLDGAPGAETVVFSVEGQSYEIDLSEKNLTKLRKSLQPFMEAGRRPALRKAVRQTRGSGARIDRAAVRAWASAQGLHVSERGRISSEVMSKYNAAH
ncbi:MAG: histone-like nucleoid-structuring protein Lsr2 [Streptosporangiaceae bacterium]